MGTFLVRVFARDVIIVKRRHESLEAATDVAASAVQSFRVVDAYAVVYDYIPWG